MTYQYSDLPFSQACENNKQPILEHLAHLLFDIKNVLEIGSGTGQHCIHFAKHLPNLIWQPSDQADYLDGLQARISFEGTDNILPPIMLEVQHNWPTELLNYEAIFSANTLHIMSKDMVSSFFERAASSLITHGKLIIYGPFNYAGEFTSDSNRTFNQWLINNNPLSGIRDIQWIIELASKENFKLVNDFPMPANNRLLHFIKH